MTETRFPEARAPRGMVATPHLLATQSGVAALRAGGNALDAAIAAAATIAVVYPHMNGLGGDNVWLIHDARSQNLRALCGVGRAARAATIDWYVARRLVAAAAAAGSPLALEDLAEHRSEWMEPLRIPYAEGHAVSFPPPTQGLSALAVLGMIERFDVASLPEADYVHLVVEATKLAFEDRDRYLTDPTHMRVAAAELLGVERLQARARLISPAHARPSQPAAPAGGDTIALVTADREGNAVSLIQSLYFTFGSGVMAGDTGVVLQNRGSFFSLDPGHVNALAPGKRTMHTLIPSMYLEGGRPRFVYGTMGGEGQPQTQAAILTRRLFRRLGPQAAIEAPRWLYGRTWGAASRALSLEGRYPVELARDLESRGHDIAIGKEWDDLFGHAHCIWVAPEGGLVGGSDPRADGGAL